MPGRKNIKGNWPEPVKALVGGLPARRRRKDSFVVEDLHGRNAVEILTRHAGLRINFIKALPSGTPRDILEAVKPPPGGDKQFKQTMYVLDRDPDIERTRALAQKALVIAATEG